jgi:UDP-3-O-acyl-N-acetylglucosamine deacetylase
MSQRPVKKSVPPPPPSEEDEEELDEFEEEDEFGETDLLDAMGSWFTTEDGETVASAMAGVKTALEMQNKILIKILSAMSKAPAKTPAPAVEEDIPA